MVERYGRRADRLRGLELPLSCFRPIVLSVLRIGEPAELPEDRKADWKWLERHIDLTVEKYQQKFGLTGEALMNALTDIATRPPGGDGRYSFIRHERHELQRLTGAWLSSFTESLGRRDFDLKAYLANPSDNLLRQ